MARMIDLVSPPPPSISTPNPSTTTSPPATPTSAPPRPPLLPIFITCDPARDTPSVLHRYLSEFHPSIIGLTGSWEQIKDVCKKYRVYFSTPEGATAGADYLVDHSIYFYLMGEFLRFSFRLYVSGGGFLPYSSLLWEEEGGERGGGVFR